MTDGLILYSQDFWFSDLLTVKAVPESCSAYKPYLSTTGLFWSEINMQIRFGIAPSSDSVSNQFPNPRLYLTPQNLQVTPSIINIHYRQKSNLQNLDILEMFQVFSLFALFVFSLPKTVDTAQAYPKIVHNTDPEAKCLDGSPPALYVHQGNQTDKIMIFLEGGGFCKGLNQGDLIEDCFQRSKTYLGSSTLWPESLSAEGYLSTDAQKNGFGGWTKIILAYCDGSLHQGHREQPIPYKGTNLYFRGDKIMRAQLSYIQKNFKLSSASKVVWTGSSAGAIASVVWIETVRSMLNNASELYLIPDSGVFVDFPTYQTQSHDFVSQVQNLYRVTNQEIGTPFEMCNIYLSKEQWKCLFIQYNHIYLQGKIIFIQSQYDSAAIQSVLGIGCPKNKTQGGQSLSSCTQSQMGYIQRYREAYQLLMFDIMQGFQERSYWSISCSNHVYACLDNFYGSYLNRIPQTRGLTVQQVIQSIVLSGQSRIVASDRLPYPENHFCS